jgi:hypothetical protein
MLLLSSLDQRVFACLANILSMALVLHAPPLQMDTLQALELLLDTQTVAHLTALLLLSSLAQHAFVLLANIM